MLSQESYAVRTVAQVLLFFLLAELFPAQIGGDLGPVFLLPEVNDHPGPARGAGGGEAPVRPPPVPADPRPHACRGRRRPRPRKAARSQGRSSVPWNDGPNR